MKHIKNMKKILSWQLFTEARNPEDLVDLFQITTLIEPGRNYKAFSVMKNKSPLGCIKFHISQIQSRIATGRAHDNFVDLDLDPDEIYFYEYVISWMLSTGARNLTDEVIRENFEVEKVNRVRNQDGSFSEEPTENKMNREDANTLKNRLIEQNREISFRAKRPFHVSGNSGIKIKRGSAIREKDVEIAKARERKIAINSKSREKLNMFFGLDAIQIIPEDEKDPNSKLDVVYWAGDYPEIEKLLREGCIWIWKVSGQWQSITSEDNLKYSLGLKINPNNLCSQLREIEFNKEMERQDRENGWIEFSQSEVTGKEKVMYRKQYGDVEISLISDGGLKFQFSTESAKVFMLDRNDRKIEISRLRKTYGENKFTIFTKSGEEIYLTFRNMDNIIEFARDKSRKKSTIQNLDIKLRKELLFPLRSIPRDTLLYDFLIKQYNLWKNTSVK